MLISVHIPKTVGENFHETLLAHYGERLLLDYTARPLAPGYWRRHLRWRLRHALFAVPKLANYDCIHGHFIADKFDHLVAQADVVAWLRDPVERLVSHYYYWKRVPDPRNPLCMRLIEEELSLSDFARLKPLQNVIERFLGQRKLESLAFIGMSDDYTTSMTRFARRFGFGDPNITPLNVNPERVEPKYTISESERHLIEQLNRNDMDLYERAATLVARS